MLKYAILAGIFGSLNLFFGDGRKTAFYTKVFLSFMDVVIFPKEFFNAGIVLNCWGLMYLKII